MGIKIGLLSILSSVLIGFLPAANVNGSLLADGQRPTVLISEVKIAGKIEGQPTEFVKIINTSKDVVNLDGWMIEYAKAGSTIDDCDSSSWKVQDNTANIKQVTLKGDIDSLQELVVELAMNDGAGGSLRISHDGDIFDLVGWGGTSSSGVCAEGVLAPIPQSGKSLKRLMTATGDYIDTNNNQHDFTLNNSSIFDDSSTENDDCSSVYALEFCVAPIPTPESSCSNVVLSEILPNPAGSDSGKEYIELYNPSSLTVNLVGCSLKLGNSVNDLSGVMLPGFQAFYGMVLPNADGGTVEFLTSTTEDVVNYPAGLKDEQAWALINGEWKMTERPTPGAENIYVQSVETVTESANSGVSSEVCPAGKFRNPETNRCKNVESEDDAKACQPGKVRNPETNRCKSVADAITSLKSCDSGQVRNPQTNRCRKVAGSTKLADCKEGQERSPETNRCRKVAGASTSIPKESLEKEIQKKQNISYGIFISMAILVVGYGAYEYRSNVANFLVKLKK